MHFSDVAAGLCPLCQVRGTPLFGSLRDRWHDAPGEWALHTCTHCALVWREPRAHEVAVAVLNTDTYYTHEPAAAATGWRTNVKDGALRAAAVLPMVRELLEARTMFVPRDARGRLLDVGCGNGAFLALMQQRGWEVAGVEPDAAAARIASRTIGTPVFAGALEDAPFADGSFTAITMSHVIEHVPDPVRTLQTCWRLLAPGGVLHIATPNTDSLGRQMFGAAWLHWDPPRHLFLFNARNLRTVLRQAGFADSEVRTLSRGARWSWQASRAIHHKGRLIAATPGLLAQLGAAAFHLREHFLAGPQGGEELFARAVKATTGTET